MNPLVPPPVVVAIFGVVMWAVDRKLELGKFESALQAPVAGALLIVGLLLMLVAVASLVAALPASMSYRAYSTGSSSASSSY
jgi:hypothetical protein